MKTHISVRFVCFALFSMVNIFGLINHAYAQDYGNERDENVRKKLQEFEYNTQQFMGKVPEKSVTGNENPLPHRSNSGLSSYDLINAEMDRLESKKIPIAPEIRFNLNLIAPIKANDRAANLVDELKYRTLNAIDSAKLRSSQLDEQPWSGSYWPIAKGVLAWRYGDPKFPGSINWKENAEYVSNPANTCSVDQLSPAEKYDLLVGDSEQTLTRAMLKEGEGYFNSFGTVESWMGICHGWSPASYMMARPSKAIEVLGADGITRIRFFPSDLKALASLLWANGKFSNRFIGLRCNSKNPSKDENGRVTDEECYGENPGTWHLSVVNQIGVSHRSFIMDALHDTEIWNQPIYSYSYSYFNPQTKATVSSLDQAQISIDDFKSDKFKRYRSLNAKFVAGIAMDLTYIAENLPVSLPTDGPEMDVKETVHYLYDLELGPDGEIIGGEWYSNAHPGFLWTPAEDAHAISVGDTLLTADDKQVSWNGLAEIPTQWKKAIRKASLRSQPLGRIVDTFEVLAKLQ